jgi:hypothetical protein
VLQPLLASNTRALNKPAYPIHPLKIQQNGVSMKKILAVVIIALIAGVGCSKQSGHGNKDEVAANAPDNSSGEAAANAVLSVADLDVSALSGITNKLEGACAKNKYGLSEEECIEAIQTRKNACMQQTARQFPGQLSDVSRMQEVVGSYVGCIFEK